MKIWLPFRLSSLVAAVMAANLAGCAAGGSSSESGSGLQSGQPAARSSDEQVKPVTAISERTLACLHCAP